MRPTPPSLLRLLRLLADGRAWPIADIARASGAGEAEVSLLLATLASAGVALKRPPDGTMRLGAAADLLDAGTVLAMLQAAGAPVSLQIDDECVSTNAVLMQRAAAGAPSGTALACELQTAGRGRHGSVWVTPIAGGLAFSLLWRMPRGGAGLAGLSLAAGVACVRALDRLGVPGGGLPGVGLKWPNDLVHDGRKLGGILVEAAGQPGGGAAVVCGVGMNTRLPAGARRAIGQPAVDIASLRDPPPARNALLAVLLIELAHAMTAFAADGFAAFRAAWLARHVHQGERVRLVLADMDAVEGRAVGVAEDGALLLERDGRVERFHAGEVSLRRAA